ncbi:MAG: hypothetical protein WC438_06130 [Candidatus Pacearchaeota archaeon]
MKRRIGCALHTHLGGNGIELMDGKSTGKKELDKIINACSKEAYELFFKNTKLDYEGVDASMKEGYEVRIGIEPSYMYDELKMLCIHEDKKASRLITGIAFDVWGTGIRSTTKMYKDYKYKSKFIKFIDKWHDKIFNKK